MVSRSILVQSDVMIYFKINRMVKHIGMGEIYAKLILSVPAVATNKKNLFFNTIILSFNIADEEITISNFLLVIKTGLKERCLVSQD